MLKFETLGLTVDQRRELFTNAKKELQSVQTDDEELIPFNSLTLAHVLRLQGLARKRTIYQILGDVGEEKSTLGYAIRREYQKATGSRWGSSTSGRRLNPDISAQWV